MNLIENQTFDEERALYGSDNVTLNQCRFDGPADGESALKESHCIHARNCFFNLRYPFWHTNTLSIEGCEFTQLCRAALWYARDIKITGSKLHGIKALRECSDIRMTNCDIASPEFGWFSNDIQMRNCTSTGEYFMMHSNGLDFTDVTLDGKYSFQYITNAVFENCRLDTKDAFWHARNVTVRNSIVRGEYLAWYCENVTFENCTIIGTQPLCYCKNLKLIDCELREADLAFEKSEVEASITTPVMSIKNPSNGHIQVPAVDELIMDDPNALCRITILQE